MYDYDVLIRRAHQHLEDQHLGEALKAFREASQLKPGEAEPLVQLGLLFEHFGDLDGAVKPLEKAVALDGKSAFAVLKLGLLSYFGGEMEKAAAYLGQGVGLIEAGASDVRTQLSEFAREDSRRILTELRKLEETAALARDLLAELGSPSGTATPVRRTTAEGRSPWRIGVLTALWKRPSLSRIVLAKYNAIRESLSNADLRLYAVGSEGEASRQIGEENGFTYVEYANEPLGAKWNFGLRAMRGDELDAVVIVGSDDLLNETYFLRQVELLNEGCRFSGLQDLYLLDLRTLRFAYWPGYDDRSGRRGEPIGVGRCVHRTLLDEVDWKLWDDHSNKMLDHSMFVRLRRRIVDGSNTALLNCRRENMMALDVKYDSNMWSMDQIVSAMVNVEYGEPVKLLQEFLAPSEIRALLSLSEEAQRISAVMTDAAAAHPPAGLRRLAAVS